MSAVEIVESKPRGRPRLPRDADGKLLDGTPLLRGFDLGPKTWRVDMADMAGSPDSHPIGEWLYGRLKAKHAHLNERIFPTWARGWMVSNDHLFIRTENAVAVFERYYEPLNPVPAARELFAYQREDVPLELEALYEQFEGWIRPAGVVHVEVARDSDFAISDIKNVLLFLRNRTVVVGEIDYPEQR